MKKFWLRRPLRATQCHLFLVITALLAACLSVHAQAINGTFTEWTIPTVNSEPISVVSVSANEVFFTERLGGKIGLLNLKSDTITEWSLPGSLPHDIVSRGNTVVLFCEQAGKIGMLNTRNNLVTEWTVPTPGSNPFHLERVGMTVYFTERLGNKIGRLHLNSNQLTEWSVPNSLPNGIAVDDIDEKKVWFAEFQGRIGVVDTVNNTLSEWTVPTPSVVEHVKVSDGLVYYVSFNTNKIGRLDPSTNTITEWTVPTIGGGPEDLDLHGGLIRFTEFFGNKIGTLDTSVEPGVDTVVIPVVSATTQVTTLVAPSETTVIPTSTPITPVTIVVAGVTTGGFTEWQIPTPASAPNGIRRMLGGGVVFTERFGNKIGLLR